MAASEHQLYEQVARYMQLQYPGVVYRFDLAADLKLTPGQAVKHKRLHPFRGYPDFFIAEQAEMLDILDFRGYKAVFCVGFEETKKVIDEYLGRAVIL